MTVTDERFTVFKTNDAQWHFARRAEILKRNPKIAKYFKPYPLSFVFLICTVAFRTFCLIQAALYISTFTSYIKIYFSCMFYSLVVENVLLHSCLTFSHEHSHNNLLQSPLGLVLVDMVLDFAATSFGENLGYVYSHSRFHHPNLGDPATDSELAFKYGDLSKGGISAMLELSGIVCPFQVLMKLFQKSPKSRSFPLPADWKHRKIACYIASAISLVFVYSQAGFIGTIIQMWALTLYVSPWAIWSKGQSIAEHLTQHGVPTLSAYNPIANLLFFNTGYHDEHHTFPLIPWIYLPKLRQDYPDIFKYDQPAGYFELWINWLITSAPSYRLPKNMTKIAKLMHVDLNKKNEDYEAKKTN